MHNRRDDAAYGIQRAKSAIDKHEYERRQPEEGEPCEWAGASDEKGLLAGGHMLLSEPRLLQGSLLTPASRLISLIASKNSRKLLDIFKRFTATTHHARERIIGHYHGQASFFHQQTIQIAQQRATAR
jgi:hypothetical protein